MGVAGSVLLAALAGWTLLAALTGLAGFVSFAGLALDGAVDPPGESLPGLGRGGNIEIDLGGGGRNGRVTPGFAPGGSGGLNCLTSPGLAPGGRGGVNGLASAGLVPDGRGDPTGFAAPVSAVEAGGGAGLIALRDVAGGRGPRGAVGDFGAAR
ncbi:MAG: hypothetical protein MJE77_46150 [Proteobacteria bacterium]|nr:hypothetical protein [Pseudomonadota bacterium]